MIILLAVDAASRGVMRAFLMAGEGTIASGIYQDCFGAEGVEVVPAGEEMQGASARFHRVRETEQGE